jgi:uncharacterized protein with HEPN domain
MREEADLINSFLADVDCESFLGNETLKRAVALTLANIGELSRSMSDDAKTQYSDTPWKAIRGARNVIVHDYGEVDFSVIWQTATESIPELIDAIERIERGIGGELFGSSEREENRQVFMQALEDADRQNGDMD